MSALSPARAAALACLMEAAERGRYVREVLDASARVAALDPRDAGLARRLALGATAARGCLDELLDRALTRPQRVSPRVRMALRISAFELLYLGTPAQVAVSQGVELVRSVAAGAAGLANAVLRRVAEGSAAYLAAADVPGAGRELVAAARGAGLPRWLLEELEVSLAPAQREALLACELEPAPVAVHANPGAMARGAAAVPGEAGALPGCILSPDVASLARAGAFERAEVVASDENAQLVATAATRSGSCLEVGAGRGTKTFVMAAQARRAGFERRHVALDVSAGKLAANAARLERAGLGGASFAPGDARDLDAALAAIDTAAGRRVRFDTVLVDAPCSGTGTMRRHPEIPWRLTREEACAELPALQLELLQQAAGRVAPGGELFYATCSVLAGENEGVLSAFLASEQGSAFEPVPLSGAAIFALPAFSAAGEAVRRCEGPSDRFQSCPAPGRPDGHFCARLRRL